MTKKYAPLAPDVSLHRPRDPDYLRELLAAAVLSQRSGARAIGVDERTMRNKASGDSDLHYPEQFALEVLADAQQQEITTMNAVRETVAAYAANNQIGTQWYKPTERKLTKNDAGKMIVGVDRFGAPIHGTLELDGFGLKIAAVDGIDVHDVTIDRVYQYTLLDPPPRG